MFIIEPMTIGDKVKLLRKKIKMTQQELAEAAGLSFTFINYLENGKRKNPSQDTIAALAKALNTSSEFLVEGERNPQRSASDLKFKRIPVISWVQAGKWHEAVDPYPPGVAEE
jgi:transcriptional regulator with XRE-family HTH domain